MSLIDIHIQPEDFTIPNDGYDEMNVQLADDDQIESRCGEIFISHRKILIFVCTECKENFYSYDDFFTHLCEQHISTEEDLKYDPTDDSTNGELVDENLVVIMDQDEEDVKPLIKPNSHEALVTEEFSQELLDTFESIDEYETLDESEAYNTDDNTAAVTNSQLKPKRSLLKINPPQNPIADEVTESLPSSTPQLKCPHCPEIYTIEFDLKNHLKLHEATRKYKCEICGFRFTLISNLRAHVRRHIGEKQFACDECEKHFWTSTELNTHRRKHTGERPFICEFCGSAFKTSGALTDHERRHTQKKRHKCSECDRSFLHLQVLREHMNTHTLDRPYVCQVCKATFARKHSLTQHLSLHSIEKKYICEICSKDFAQLPGLLAHKKRHELD